MSDIYAKERVINANESKIDLFAKQGATWIIQFTFPSNYFSGKSARGHIRKKFSDALPIASWILTIDGTNTVLTATIKAVVSSTITCGSTIADPKSEYFYDIEIYSGTGADEVVSRSINGKLYVDPQVTK